MTTAPLNSTICAAVLLICAAVSCAQENKSADKPKKPISELIKALRDNKDYSVTEAARNELGPEGPHGKLALLALIEALPDTDEINRTYFLYTIGDYGLSAIPELNRALQSKNALIRAGAAEAIGTIALQVSPVDSVVPLIEALHDPDRKVRERAATSIGWIHKLPEKSVPALVLALRDKDIDVRDAAARSLQWFKAKAAPAVPELIANLTKQQCIYNTVGALAAIGPAAKSAVPALLNEFKATKDEIYRSRIVEAFKNIGQDAKAAVPALIDAIPDAATLADWPLIEALGHIGPDAKDAVPKLLKLVQNRKNDYVSMTAMEALGRIGPAANDAVPALLAEIDTARDDSGVASATAARALGGIGPEAKAALPALLKVARDGLREERERRAAAEAVIKIDPVVAAREKMETAYLSIRLGKIPDVKMMPRVPATDEQRKNIKKLIGGLAGIDDMELVDPHTWGKRTFSPLWQKPMLEEAAKDESATKSREAFKALVAAGPHVIPLLLDSLEDRTPTKAVERDGGLNFALVYTSEIEWNPLNQIENRILSRRSEFSSENDGWGSYTIKVGDICSLAIGQIVGRDYAPVRFQGNKIGSLLIRCPSEIRELRERIRSIWSSKDAAQRLFDSLLLDYSTEGIFNGKSLNGWQTGSDFQIDAAIRLLYYFPKEAAPLIAARLKSLDVMDTKRPGKRDSWIQRIQRDVKNGIITKDFIEAVKWCKEPAIAEALADIEKRTDDPAIRLMIAGPPE